MVEPGRSAAARETMTKKKLNKKKQGQAEGVGTQKLSSSHCTEAESPSSYRLALRNLFSCRNSHGQPADSRSKLGFCKLRDDSSQRHREIRAAAAEEETAGKRRASVSGGSERCVKKAPKSKQHLQRGGSTSSASSGGGSSFRAGMQLKRLSGCYECHMVVDPVGGGSMRVCPCPDCGEVFVRQESLLLHQSIRHAVCELGPDDTSRNIIEIIFQSSWLKQQHMCRIERILKVHNTARTLARFEEYRDAVKARCSTPRCTADGNELLRFHCATLACALGLDAATHLCHAAGCGACAIIRDGFSVPISGGVRTTATSGRAHDAAAAAGLELEEERSSRAMLVCRVIAGRVKRPPEDRDGDGEEEFFDSVAGSAGVYSNLEELLVFNPSAILPCFVVVYKAPAAPA